MTTDKIRLVNPPSVLNYRFHPLCVSDFLNPVASNSEAKNWLDVQREALKRAKDCIRAAQVRRTQYADQSRKATDFLPVEKVLVHRDYLMSSELRNQPCSKLRSVWLGPFEVLSRISTNIVKLRLPSSCKAHPVLNIAAIKKSTMKMIFLAGFSLPHLLSRIWMDMRDLSWRKICKAE